MSASDFMAGLTRRPGASVAEIEVCERSLGRRLPDDYRALLRSSNGAEGFVAADVYVMLWSTGELVELNEAYAVSEFAPGLVLVGTNGGDTGYGFIEARGSAQYVRVPLIGLSIHAAEPIGQSMAALLGRLRRS